LDVPVTIRPALPEDAARFAAIYAPYVRKTVITFETEAPDEADFARRLAAAEAAGCPWLSLLRGETVIGYAYAAPFRERAAFAWDRELSVYLAREERGRGLGRRLLAALLRLLRAQGCRTAYSLIALPGEASLALHRSLGFVQGGMLPRCGYKLGRWVDLAILYLPLAEGEAPAPLIPFAALPQETVAATLAER